MVINGMDISGFDHIVIGVADVPATLRFYEAILGLEPREERPGKWSLHFGANKISVQDASNMPPIAQNTTPGSGNFCLLTETPIAELVETLAAHDVEILDGPAIKIGAVGEILSVYFHDPDGNLVEISNLVEAGT